MTSWYEIAKQEVGTAEIVGPQHNPRVLRYFKLAGHGSILNDETAWCSAFACYCVEMAGIQSPKTLWARSWMNWGAPVAEPYIGCIAVFTRGDGGHVGFFAGWSQDGTKVLVLGGNQSNKVNYQYYPVDRLLGFREPQSQVLDSVVAVAKKREEPKVVENALREDGSKTITAADRSDKVQVVTGIGGLIALVMQFFNDLSPLVVAMGAGTIAALAIAAAAYTIWQNRKIKEARVKDQIEGLHIGRAV